MFPDQDLRRLSVSSPLFDLPDMKISTIGWRRQTSLQMGGVRTPSFKAISIGGRPAVIVSRHDVTGGLLGCPSASVYGYSAGTLAKTGSAFRLMRNISVYAAKQKR